MSDSDLHRELLRGWKAGVQAEVEQDPLSFAEFVDPSELGMSERDCRLLKEYRRGMAEGRAAARSIRRGEP